MCLGTGFVWAGFGCGVGTGVPCLASSQGQPITIWNSPWIFAFSKAHWKDLESKLSTQFLQAPPFVQIYTCTWKNPLDWESNITFGDIERKGFPSLCIKPAAVPWTCHNQCAHTKITCCGFIPGSNVQFKCVWLQNHDRPQKLLPFSYPAPFLSPQSFTYKIIFKSTLVAFFLWDAFLWFVSHCKATKWITLYFNTLKHNILLVCEILMSPQCILM